MLLPIQIVLPCLFLANAIGAGTKLDRNGTKLDRRRNKTGFLRVGVKKGWIFRERGEEIERLRAGYGSAGEQPEQPSVPKGPTPWVVAPICLGLRPIGSKR